ncbi:class I SAM-dependent methyltransferase [Cellulomonas sp.]|uniref:class I SAM-dependent methyltransferase n=1 Tax=Cellulomonas sp. TaxID=40001 RepID=UPI002811B6A4|nr:class I SAM-dependent methyltransferase [Cellulomonas sp.]
MQNETAWRPSKFVRHGDSWRGSRDPAALSRASRVTADLQAAAYADALATHASGHLLDLGCGTVPAYGMFRDRVDRITCVDWADSPHPGVHVDHVADLREPLPLPDEQYDTVLLTDVLEHMPYPDALFAELRRVLRPRGRLVVGVPFLYGLHEEPHDHHRYTEHRLRLFCEDHDLEVLELYPYGGHVAVALDLASKMLGAFPPTRLVAGVPALFASPALGRRRTPLPLGYVLVARRPSADVSEVSSDR